MKDEDSKSTLPFHIHLYNNNSINSIKFYKGPMALGYQQINLALQCRGASFSRPFMRRVLPTVNYFSNI